MNDKPGNRRRRDNGGWLNLPQHTALPSRLASTLRVPHPLRFFSARGAGLDATFQNPSAGRSSELEMISQIA
jgi:hypothetical protein